MNISFSQQTQIKSLLSTIVVPFKTHQAQNNIVNEAASLAAVPFSRLFLQRGCVELGRGAAGLPVEMWMESWVYWVAAALHISGLCNLRYDLGEEDKPWRGPVECRTCNYVETGTSSAALARGGKRGKTSIMSVETQHNPENDCRDDEKKCQWSRHNLCSGLSRR